MSTNIMFRQPLLSTGYNIKGLPRLSRTKFAQPGLCATFGCLPGKIGDLVQTKFGVPSAQKLDLPSLHSRLYWCFLHWLATIVILSLILPPNALAQEPGSWSKPLRLNPNEDDGQHPIIVSDSSGIVHVFWSSFAKDDYPAILYSYLKDGVWTEPIDIFIATDPSTGFMLQVTIDSQGWLHLIWDDGSIYYSRVPVAKAGDVQAWAKPRKLSYRQGAAKPDIFLDEQGRLHVVYVDLYDSPYVRYTQSSDNGQTWSIPMQVSDPRNNAYAIDTRIAVDKRGVLHVVWSESIDPFPPSGVYYAQSSDQGQTWTEPLELASGGYAWVSIGIDGDENIHLFWTGTSTDDRNWRGKYHTWSSDGGKNWDPIKPLWGKAAGLLGFADMAVDSDGVLHLVSAVGGFQSSSPGEILYVSWLGDRWSTPDNLSLSIMDANPEKEENNYPHITISGGNIAHVVWSKLYGKQDEQRKWYIWYSSTRLPSPAVPLVEVPTPNLPKPTPQPTATSKNVAHEPIDKINSSSTTPYFSSVTQDVRINNPGNPLLFSIIPTLIVIGVVIIIAGFRLRS